MLGLIFLFCQYLLCVFYIKSHFLFKKYIYIYSFFYLL